MFSHRQPSKVTKFVTLFTVGGTNITASHRHYLWVMDRTFKTQVVRAGDVMVGDCLVHVGAKGGSTLACVAGKVEKIGVGLYNPHTASGTIVVDGIATLTFTDTLPPSLFVHAMVTMPARLVFSAFKAVGGMMHCNALNDALLSIYFNTPWALFSNLLSGGQSS